MKELELFEIEQDLSEWKIENFSFDNYCDDKERKFLEEKFINLTEISDDFNRQSVSFQLSKNDCIHRWLKYKEGFSSDLVTKLLGELEIKENDIVLDPFMGSGTTAIVCKMNNINCIGYDILPMTEIAINAKKAVQQYDVLELKEIYSLIEKIKVPENYSKKFEYIPITYSAFPENSEKEIIYITDWLDNCSFSDNAKSLLKLCILNSLEISSYTRKDGQYLAWDTRSKKIEEANKIRIARGAKPIDRLNKGNIPTFKETLLNELNNVIIDIIYLQKENVFGDSFIKFKQGSSLLELPKLKGEILDGVITSPPYCNRYDYTRTYALELNYLGFSPQQISQMRQDLISCTVENKLKIDYLREYYESLCKLEDYNYIKNILYSTRAFKEIIMALNQRNYNGEINNKGVLRMVEGYFTDLTFIYAEIYRLCKPGASVAVVNDNVRYAGEVIPVDFLCCEIAEKIGFVVKKIYTLKQKKGNSSQQMAKYGRIALRKSITIWQKPY
ncbi:MAG: site-specific DNA-methyltransferase [Prevotella sp.]|nr:site-specific DNA-methyltransferase [Prevotella sp.]